MKRANDDTQMRSGLAVPDAGGERLTDDAGDRCIRRRTGSAAAPHPRPPSGQVVLDPFFGTGTTGAVASAGTSSASTATPPMSPPRSKRIAAIRPAPVEAIDPLPTKRSARASRSVARRNGPDRSGTELTDMRRRWSAMVRADGTLSSGPHTGSIHRVPCARPGAEACCGRTFWHTQNNGPPLLSTRCAKPSRAPGQSPFPPELQTSSLLGRSAAGQCVGTGGTHSTPNGGSAAPAPCEQRQQRLAVQVLGLDHQPSLSATGASVVAVPDVEFEAEMGERGPPARPVASRPQTESPPPPARPSVRRGTGHLGQETLAGALPR